MKENTVHNLDPFTRMVDTELSSLIVEVDLANVQKHLGTAQKLSSTLDFDQLHPTTTIADYVGGITADYQLPVNEVDVRINGGLQTVKGQSHIDNSKEESVKVNHKIRKVANDLAPLKGKFNDSAKRFAPEVLRYLNIILPMTVVIACVELLANFEIFALLGGGLLSNIAISVLIAICVYWYGHFTPSKVKKYGNGILKREIIIFVCYLVPLTILFYLLSSMRIQYLVVLNPDMEEVFVSSPWVFTMANVFAYLVICWLVIAYRPKKEVLNGYKNYKLERKEIQVLEDMKTALEDELSGINPELRSKLTDHYNILLLGKQKEQEIVSRMQACFEQFKLELFLRTNGACAPLFTGDIEKDLPKLNLNYNHVQPKIPSA